MIQTRCGVDFSFDACCANDGTDALCKAYCSLKTPFLESQVTGQHVWLDPPVDELIPFLMHYLHCKQQSCHDISACILVPHDLISQWSARGMLVGMQLLHYFPKGSHLYPGEAGRIPWDANVYYDPPRAALNALLHHSGEHQM